MLGRSASATASADHLELQSHPDGMVQPQTVTADEHSAPVALAQQHATLPAACADSAPFLLQQSGPDVHAACTGHSPHCLTVQHPVGETTDMQLAMAHRQQQGSAAVPAVVQQAGTGMQHEQQQSGGIQPGSSQVVASARKGKFSRLRLQPRATVVKPGKSPSPNADVNASASHVLTSLLPPTQQLQSVQDATCLTDAALPAQPMHAKPSEVELKAGPLAAELSGGRLGTSWLLQPEPARAEQPRAVSGPKEPIEAAQKSQQAVQALPEVPVQAELQQNCLQAQPAVSTSRDGQLQQAPAAASLQGAVVEPLPDQPQHSAAMMHALDGVHCANATVTSTSPRVQQHAVDGARSQWQAASTAQQQAAVGQSMPSSSGVAVGHQHANMTVTHQQHTGQHSQSAASDKQNCAALPRQPQSDMAKPETLAAGGNEGTMSQFDADGAFTDDWAWQPTQGVFGFQDAYQPSQAFGSHDKNSQQRTSWHGVKPPPGTAG